VHVGMSMYPPCTLMLASAGPAARLSDLLPQRFTCSQWNAMVSKSAPAFVASLCWLRVVPVAKLSANVFPMQPPVHTFPARLWLVRSTGAAHSSREVFKTACPTLSHSTLEVALPLWGHLQIAALHTFRFVQPSSSLHRLPSKKSAR
jgi:hypothetical protein